MQNTQSSYQFTALGKETQQQELGRLKNQNQTVIPVNSDLLAQIGVCSGMTGLDLGCGSGITSFELAKVAYPGQVIGFDLSEAMLEQAQQNQNFSRIENLSFQQGNAENLPFADNSFDFIHSRLLFQHLSQPAQAFSHIYRVLKPGGIFYTIDIDHSWFSIYPEPESLKQFCQKFVKTQQERGGDPFMGRKLAGYSQQAGLVKIQTQIELISSDRLGLEAFFNLLSFGAPYRAQSPEFDQLADQAKKDVYQLLLQPATWAGFGVFVITAQKPT